jgi:hypothetical protein
LSAALHDLRIAAARFLHYGGFIFHGARQRLGLALLRGSRGGVDTISVQWYEQVSA